MERMENPFKNLHPKIYHRQKNAAFKRGNVNLNKIHEREHQASLSLGSSKHNNSTSLVKVNSQAVIDQQNAPKRGERKSRREENSERKPCSDDYIEQEKLNRRNMFVSRKSFEGENLVLPWLASPYTTRDNTSLMPRNSRVKPFGENSKGLFPPIEVVPSFICPTSWNDRKPWRKVRCGDTKDIMGPRLTENDESLWNTRCDPRDRLGENNGNQIPPVEGNRRDRSFPECDDRRTLCGLHNGITKAYCSRDGAKYNIQRHMTSKILPSRTNGNYEPTTEEMRMNYMVLKAKIHRSTFL